MNNQAVKAAQEAVQRSEELDIRFVIPSSTHASRGLAHFHFIAVRAFCGMKVSCLSSRLLLQSGCGFQITDA